MPQHHILTAFFLSFFSVYQHVAVAAPSTLALKADIALLAQNALDAPPKTSTLLIAKALTQAEAVDACAALGETLLSVPVPPVLDSKKFNEDLYSIMSGLGMSSRFRRTMFWVEVEDNPGCSVISTNARLQSVQCDSRLPVFCTSTNEDDDARQIEVTSKGVNYVGTRDVHSFRFLGIPYAGPTPRFSYSNVLPQPTVDEAENNQTINALESKAACPSKVGDGSKGEDCLNLDIYTPYLPVNPARSKMMKPVLVWFEDHNGNRDGGKMVSRSDVVVVRVKSRVGALGYLSLDDGITNGNFGLGDKVNALHWIRAHIADFGGDPTLVTIQGEAQTIKALLGVEKAWGLFIGAVLHGTQESPEQIAYSSPEENHQAYGKKLVEATACHEKSKEDVLACLKEVPLADILTVLNGSKSRIVKDGTYVTTSELKFDELGEMVRVHVMFGWENESQKTVETVLTETYSEDAREAVDVDIGFGIGQEIMMDLNSTQSAQTDKTGGTSSGTISCQQQTIAIKSAKNDLFPSVWAYTYKKEYEDALYGALDLSATEEKSRPDLLLLAQNTADAIGAFARASNPNPSQAYLDAHGYVNVGDKWQPLKAFAQPVDKTFESNGWPIRLLDVPSSNALLQEKDCTS